MADHGAPSFAVDGSRGVDEMTAAVESHFRDALTEGPRAVTPGERRALLREQNEDVLAQCRGFLSRPWVGADEETYRREFLCECADPVCERLLELTVADAARRLAEARSLVAHAAASVVAR